MIVVATQRQSSRLQRYPPTSRAKIPANAVLGDYYQVGTLDERSSRRRYSFISGLTDTLSHDNARTEHSTPRYFVSTGSIMTINKKYASRPTTYGG